LEAGDEEEEEVIRGSCETLLLLSAGDTSCTEGGVNVNLGFIAFVVIIDDGAV